MPYPFCPFIGKSPAEYNQNASLVNMIISVPGDRILTFVMIEYFVETSYIWVLTKKPPEADQNCHLPENFLSTKE